MTACLNTRRAALIAAFLAAAVAGAGTTTINFDGYAAGTAITNQYAGVTFSAPPNSCGGAGPVQTVIAVPTGGTSSDGRALSTEMGCPDFSPDYIRIVFDNPQSLVTFTLGTAPGPYQVRGYTTTSGGSAVTSQNITIAGESSQGVYRLVTVTRTAGDLRRIEIQNTLANWEYIDDLTFACPDVTPPHAVLTAPAFEAGLCGSVSVSIRGLACDPDGQYQGDKLEYLRADDPNAAWTLYDSATTAQCSPNGLLYVWNTTGYAEGWYYLRLTVTNACELQSSAVVLVYVDRSFEDLELTTPASAGQYGGIVHFEGTVEDRWFSQYTVKSRPSSGGAYMPVDPNNSVYTPASGVVNGPLAQWNTTSGVTAAADGNYSVQVVGTDDCGNSLTSTRTIGIDNTRPTAMISAPDACTYVDGLVDVFGTATDLHLSSWVLYWGGGAVTEWQVVAQRNVPVSNGLLGTWDTAGLPDCVYALRLVVWDHAVVNGDASQHNTREYVTAVSVGLPPADADLDADGDVDIADFGLFSPQFTGPLP